MTQQQALTILKTGANVFLTGEPGAGKSHTINEFTRYARTHGIEPAITASTGIAATHIGGMTIHSWSGIGIKRTLTPYDLDRIASSEHIAKRIRRTKILIIDEVSMLSPDTLGMVDAVCREVLQSTKAFGGLQVVLVGDFFQLPPIVKKEEEKDEGGSSGDIFFEEGNRRPRFAYDSGAWVRANPIVCYLTEQHRQDDKVYLDLLTAIRRNTFSEDNMPHIEARKIAPGKAPAGAPKLFSHNADVDRINDETLSALEGSPKGFPMLSQGAPLLVATLKKSCLSPEALFLKPGASVMFTKNNPKEGYVNGTLGTVVSFDKHSGYPSVRIRSGRTVMVEPAEWMVEEGGKIRARINQLPLRLAWAITVHKSQGMSLDEAIMDLSGVFEYGQGYVALSRVRRLGGLYLLGWNRRTFEVHPEVLSRDEVFRSASEEAVTVFDAFGADDLGRMQNNFVIACGGSLQVSPTQKEETGQTPHTARMSKLREKHPNAYRPWDDNQDKRLKELFTGGASPASISKTLGRQKGSIRARLLKLGLIEEE